MELSKYLSGLTKLARPEEPTWLLLRVAIGGDADAALAWSQWTDTKTTIEPSKAAVRLMPSVAERLTRLGIACSPPDAVATARRNTFLSNHSRLTAARPLIERLSAEMPVMLLKGGARIAANPKDLHLRVIRDVDLLFRPEDLARALEIAMDSGYRSISGVLPGPVKSRPLAPLFFAGEGKSAYMELDFHSAPLRFGRLGSYDAGLWQRAVDADILGVPVKIPSGSDRFLQAIAHGLVFDDDRPADWIVDSYLALQDPSFDAHVVADEARRRRIGLPVLVAASLLNELGTVVPTPILSANKRDLSNPLYRRELAASMKPMRARTLLDRAFVIGAELHRSWREMAHIPSWKTSWLATPSLRRKQSSWSRFANGRATIAVSGMGPALTVRLAGVPPGLKRPSFDVLLEDKWIGRIRFRLAYRFAPVSPASWRVRMTFRYPSRKDLPDPARLTVVALDENKTPTTSLPDGMSLTIEPARK